MSSKPVFLCVLLALLVLANVSDAQVIDYLSIDDPSGELSIHGTFDKAVGTVYVDSVSVPILSWLPDAIIVQLADSGRGSCGPVQVATSNWSNSVLLSMWYMQSYVDYTSHGPLNSNQEEEAHFQFRADLAYLLRLAKMQPGFLFRSSTASSRLRQRGQCNPDRGSDGFPSYDTLKMGSLPYKIDVGSRKLQFNTEPLMNMSNVAFDFISDFSTQFEVLPKGYSGGVYGGVANAGLEPERRASFIPTDSQLAVHLTSGVTGTPPLSAMYVDGKLAIQRTNGLRSELEVIDVCGRTIIRVDVTERDDIVSIKLPSGLYFARCGSVVRFLVP